MASFFDSGATSVSQMTVCHICGDEGDAQLLINCAKCQDFLVHKYCCSNFSPEDEKVAWMCEECAPEIAKGRPSRKSERINSKKVRDFEVRLKWIKMLNKKISTAKRQACTEVATLKKDHSSDRTAIDEQRHADHSSDQAAFEEQRYEMTEDGNLSPGLTESAENKAMVLVPCGPCVPLNRPSLESSNHICAQPLKDPIWSGQFTLTNGEDEITVGIMGHLSSKACSKVFNAAAALPSALEIEVLDRCDAWPKSFQSSPPTDDSIGLYLFPKCESDEKLFDGVLDDMNEDDLALKAKMDNVELLIFSSLELPKQHWRIHRKYYLWGVFVQKRQYSLPTTDHTVVQSSSAKFSKQSRMRGLIETSITMFSKHH